MHVEVEDLGRAAFAPVHQRMLELHRAVADGAPGRVLLVEHEPVYTAGRATPPEQLIPGAVPIERGGKVTWHGPGQLVVYPIVPLPRRDLRDWLRRIEAFGIAVCARFGLQATASDDGTGVFVGGRKVGSIGVAVKRWVNLHGIALNVAVVGQPWHAIQPCGLPPEIMSDLSTACGRAIDMAVAKDAARAEVLLLVGPPAQL